MSHDTDRKRIQARWDEIFRVAKDGFTEHGRGVVLVSDWGVELRFALLRDVPGAATNPNIAKAIAAYDPAREAVVVRLGSGGASVAVYELRRRPRR